uniref:Universal stress protein n=1 Tax=Thermodesulfobacterium geofontis TaxID=1295609 RepID=A0A7V4JRI1_9BACT
MENIKKIDPHLLVCYDGTPASTKIISYLKELFSNTPLEITLLKIISHPSASQSIETDLYKKLQKEAILEEKTKEVFLQAEKELKEVSERLKEHLPAKVYTKVLFKYGDIAEDIINFSKENLFDAILVGRRGLSKIATYILGGVTHKLIVLSPIPVWLIRGDKWNKKIFVSFDLSETGLKLADYVSFIFANHKDIEMTFFHNFNPFSDLKYFEGNIEELVELTKNKEYREFFINFKNRISENGLSLENEKIKFKLKRGFLGPAGEIMREVKKGDYTTVVVGRREKKGIEGFFLGSVSQKIISYFDDRAIWVVN